MLSLKHDRARKQIITLIEKNKSMLNAGELEEINFAVNVQYMPVLLILLSTMVVIDAFLT